MRVVDVSQELSHFIVKRYVLWLRDHCHLLHHLRHHLLEGDADDLRLNSLLGSWSWSLSEVVGVAQGTDVLSWSWWRLLPWQGKVDGVGWVGVAQVRAEAQVGVEEWEEELNCSILNQALHKCTELFLVQPVKSRHQTHTLWPGAGCSAQHLLVQIISIYQLKRNADDIHSWETRRWPSLICSQSQQLHSSCEDNQ